MDIFSIDPVQFQFHDDLLKLEVSNNILVMAMSSGKLKRIDLQQAQIVEGKLFLNLRNSNTQKVTIFCLIYGPER